MLVFVVVGIVKQEFSEVLSVHKTSSCAELAANAIESDSASSFDYVEIYEHTLEN